MAEQSWTRRYLGVGSRGLESFPEVHRRELGPKTSPPEFPEREHKEVGIEQSVKLGPRREGYPQEA